MNELEFCRTFTRQEWAEFLRRSVRQNDDQRRFAIHASRHNRFSFRAHKGDLVSIEAEYPDWQAT